MPETPGQAALDMLRRSLPGVNATAEEACGNLDSTNAAKVWIDPSTGSVYVVGSAGTDNAGAFTLAPTQMLQLVLRIKTKQRVARQTAGALDDAQTTAHFGQCASPECPVVLNLTAAARKEDLVQAQSAEVLNRYRADADPVLADIVRRIVAVEPKARVILFGSRAKGTARPDSDYDFAIIVPWLDPGRSPSGHIRRGLRGIDVAMDLLVLTQADWDRGVATYGSVLGEVLAEGVVLHGG